MFKSILFLSCLLLVFACAHHNVQEDVVAAPTTTPLPAPKPQIKYKYVYVKTPETVSAMSTAPFERETETPPRLRDEIVRIFWPLLTMLAAGAVLILGLLIEHLVLNHQLIKRAQIRARLRAEPQV